MRILAIRGKNLASLAGEFEVDFQQEPLLGAGLFAISGPTGAGKSTLLDALCLALFDDTPRLKGADSRGIELPDVGAETTLPNDRRNILRRGAAEGYAEVDFLGNDGVGYRSRWSVRRAGLKTGGRLQKIEMTLVRLADQQPVGGHLKSEVEKTIVEKIGLSFEQFTRAVLLAQNEFFTFLKASDDERAALLQTLTGTDRFEILSKRAFERHKAEQDKLRLLRERLDDQQPLSAEERARLESERAAAATAIQTQAEREKLLAAYLRWHQELEQALQREAAAQAEVEQALAQREAATPRRAHFELVEAVQGARPLLAETQRLERAHGDLAGQFGSVQEGISATTQACTGAKSANESASAVLNTLESASQQFAPLIEQARQLDLELAARRSAQASAAKTQRSTTAALTQAQGERDSNRKALEAVQGQLQSARQWLAGHRYLQALGEGWLRWDTLFGSAAEEQQRVAQTDEELEALGRQGQRQTEALAEGEARLAEASQGLQASEQELQIAGAALTQFDGEALARAKTGLDGRKEALRQAEQVWRERSAGAMQLEALDREAREIGLAVATAQALLEQARAQRPPAQASAQQAERDWRVVFEAAQESVAALREQLQADAPCPVCGALEHPYVARNPALDNALARLQESLERCRKDVQELDVAERTQLNQLETLGARSEQNRQRQAQLERGQESVLAAWASAVSGLSGMFGAVDEAEFPDWLAGQLAQIQEQAQALAEQESRLRQATDRRQKAQERLNAVRKAHDALKDEVARLKASAERTLAARQSARDHQASAQQRLAQALDQLDSAHDSASWRTLWAAEPRQYYDACRRNAAEWSAQKNNEDTLLADQTSLEAAALGLARQANNAEAELQQASQALAECNKQLEEQQAARRGVFAGVNLPAHPDGVPTPSLAELEAQLVDNYLASASAAARRQQVDSLHAFKECERQLAVQQETLAQLAKQLEANRIAAQQATSSLAQWLAAFNAREAQASPLDHASLHGLLAHDADWIAAERQALGQLETAVASANGGLARMRNQRAVHENARPAPDAVETVQANLEQVAASLNGLRESLGGVELALRRDDEIRQKAAELLDVLAAQEKTARLWARMNELIGAADGKKFRNYAQQLTLDILLGYANAHLKDLSRRYRLNRVKDSLALMVIDQDMGDEARSVHSLSGGESFLVSLALALGLASLSSHRVRVESLFIDEGFGSLDADTLRVAMDALDSLQAMGRKVGVISHVQEMTERIGTCVQVKRLAGGQSRVVVAGL